MIDEFLSKFNNNEYISNYLYEYVLNNNSSIIPTGFNIDEYNGKILDKLYVDNKDYFDNMYKEIDDNIHLDEEQCKAILADEKYSLIIAGAGTGKTTTMVSKVKYLVDKKNADPERILVMSYTRKATEEIANRIEENFDLPVHVTTFHSLGYEYIQNIEIFKDKQKVILDLNTLNEIYLKYFRKIFEDKNKIREIIDNFEVLKKQKRLTFVFSKYFMDNYMKYDTYDEFLDAYVNDKIEEARTRGEFELRIQAHVERNLLKDDHITSIKGEYVKSAGELVIANFLYKHGLDYSYEEVYDEIMENGAIYKPDFTIDYGGEKIYIEYFGLYDKEYNRIRKWKEKFHQEQGNKFIEIDRLPLDMIVEVLDEKLKNLGIQYHDLSNEEIYEHILRLNPISQVYPFIYFLRECVECRKESFYREDLNIAREYVQNYSGEDNDSIRVQYKYIMDFEQFYFDSCFKGDCYYFDFADLLHYSVKYLEKLVVDTKLRFDYIIIDEYQDISQIKYELTYKTAKRNDAKVYAVGDDWQSIYAFSGSRIEYIYRFKEFFKGAKAFKISKTYRNSQELINYSGEFIMRNEDQLKKQLVSDKSIPNPIEYRYFDSRIDPPNDNRYDPSKEIACLKNTIKEIHEKNPEHNILILGRTNKMIDRITDDEELVDDIGTKIVFKGYEDIQIEGMTMHKSKGLNFDEVILIGLNKSFPSNKSDIYWYEALYKNKPIEEAIPFAEERRLFYVALTRTKNKVYLLIDQNVDRRSEFVKEIDEIIKKIK